ncbi:hypothetical protein FA592_13430 [Sulfurospirillum diekertiae]|uniref:Uncharacterized protein n=1 Tax=Sulfurospirillum diekertiae TaxID=1854492 RepID=A0A6G9VUG2_9BACT|nr:hypothetical protein [Sulfurospirillum diekertiae]QIR77181.1 hypothetical protein FA584_13635 [Sulfurospirillum diekertiae]QIR79795.1 hypothetical protein FA592_13430 [Sulfurospirillum diekertiae]
MKNVVIFLLAFLPIIFSGCAKHYAFNEENIGLQKNDFYSKVENQNVCVVESSKVITRTPRDMALLASQTMDLDVNNVASGVAKKNFEQYFKTVKMIKNQNECSNGLVVYPDVKDYHFLFEAGTGAGFIKYDMTINVYLNNKLILNKQYQVEDTDHIVFRLGAGFKKHSDWIDELYHKSLFNLFETQIKQDIINAL